MAALSEPSFKPPSLDGKDNRILEIHIMSDLLLETPRPLPMYLDLLLKQSAIGCTLFSNITEDQKATISLFNSDFSNTHGWSVERHNMLHRRDIDQLNNQVKAIAMPEPHRSYTNLRAL